MSRREALVLGRDVEEVDAWGMDCYTRRNILDGAPRCLPRGLVLVGGGRVSGSGGAEAGHATQRTW